MHKISFLFSAIVHWDLDYVVARFAKDGHYPPERVEVDEILDCVLRHGVPDITKDVATP